MNAKSRTGFALLEVIIALVILSTAAVSVIIMMRQTTLAVEQAREADTNTSAASSFMEHVALWPREDLDRRLGERHQGPWILYIDRPHTLLYRAALYDSSTRSPRGKPIIETAMFRATPLDATQ